MSAPSAAQNNRDRIALGGAALALVVGALIWVLWVLPIARSVGEATPTPIGVPVVVDLEAGERVGIWSSGLPASFGTMDCTVTSPEGAPVPQVGPPSLTWDDTLWWMTPRRGFEQLSQIVGASAGPHTIECSDSLDRYDGEVLVAGDAFGPESIGLGRTGSSDFAGGTLLAFGAVVCPPFAVLLPIVIGLRRLRDRRRAR